ncbi:MAG: AMP-binding protein, partial [Actinomycetota bacterium]|nr:AMP-binding protein [Actinomycetota bacterium]
MHRLVASLLPGGPRFVDELRRVWDEGDALLPIDLRLPVDAQQRLIERMGAAVVVGSDGERHERPGRPVEDGDALVMATSGSTGEPKGVVLTHDAVRANSEATSAYLEVHPGTDKWLSCLPLSHVGGLSVVFRALLTDTPLEVHGAFDATAVTDAARRGATLASFVPTAMARIDASLFRKILVGGSALPVDRPPNSVATYGMTETGSGVVYDRRPLDGVEIRTVDGEIQLRCPMLLRCYRDGTDPRTA